MKVDVSKLVFENDNQNNTELKLENGSHYSNRAYKLSNGDIFTVQTKQGLFTLQFEDQILHEVVEVEPEESEMLYMSSKYERTGIKFTPDELNAMF